MIDYPAAVLTRLYQSAICALLVAVAWSAITPSTALARRPSSKQLREAEVYAKLAKEHFRNEKYGEAADLFMKVYRLSKKVTAVFNAARCKQMAGRLREARGLFELYLQISDDETGREDARSHLVQIAARLQQHRQQAEAAQAAAKKQAHEATEARKKAEAAAKNAEVARKQAEARAAALEQQKKQQLAQQKQQRAERERRAQQRRAAAEKKHLEGVVILAPVGATGGDVAIAAADALRAVTAAARAARIGKVRTVATYNSALTAAGVTGACDLTCRLTVARNLGARWAVDTSVRERNGALQLQAVLWRALDMGQDGTIKVAAATAARVKRLFDNRVPELFDMVRIFQLSRLGQRRSGTQAVGQPPPTTVRVATTPPAARLWFDGRDVGSTPRQLRVAQGWHRLQFVAPGHRPRGGLIFVQSGTTSLAKVQLIPAMPTMSPRAAPARRQQTGAVPAQGKRASVSAPLTATGRARRQRSSVVEPPPVRPVRRRRRVATTASAAQSALSRNERRDGPIETLLPGVGWISGVALHAAGSAAYFAARGEDASGGVDISLGGGLFGHIGYATSTMPFVPWFSVLAGVKYTAWQGFHHDGTSAGSPAGAETFAALAFPRLWGVQMGLHRHFVSNESNTDLDGFNMWSLGILRSRDWLYFRVAIEALLSSDRAAALDAFGAGPQARLAIELGVNFGGVKFNK